MTEEMIDSLYVNNAQNRGEMSESITAHVHIPQRQTNPQSRGWLEALIYGNHDRVLDRKE